MSTGTFVGIALELESVAQHALATVRVKFTQDPLAASSAGAHDGLNPANYVLMGPGVAVVLNVGHVTGDPQSLDLFLAGSLLPGLWALTVSNVQTADGHNLVAPVSMTFMAAALTPPEAVNKGALSDSVEDILRKHLNPALKGDGWDAIIAAIATGDQKNLDNAQLAFDQLFKSTASGIYLERKAADDGLERPANIGMPDDLFRQYSIETTNSKLVEGALLKILEVFYGDDSVRAHMDSGIAETYALQDGDDLAVLVDEQILVTTTFATTDFAIIGQARAAEVAAALTRSFDANNCNAFAIANVDPQDGTTKVRIYSGSLGLGSSIRIVGGKAQNALSFPTPLPLGAIPTWNITFLPATSTLRFSPDSSVSLSTIRIGDYVAVYGSEFISNNRGTFVITNVYWTIGAQYFDVVNVNGTSQSGLTQLNALGLTIWRPTRATIHADQARAVVVASIGEEVDVVLPATSQAVGRGPLLAAYGQVAPSIAIATLERLPGGLVTVTTASTHGLSVNSQVIIDGVWGSPTIPPVHAGTNSGGVGSLDYSKGSVWGAATLHNAAPGAGGIAVRLLDGSVFRGFGYDYVSAVVTDDQPHWSRTAITSDVVVAGERQVSYNDHDVGAVVAQMANFPAASLGTGTTWHFGQVLISGGDTLSGIRVVLNNVQVYDQALGTVTALNTLNTARAQHLQVTQKDGSFLVIGGMDTESTTTATVERYGISDGGVWITRTSMSEPRAQAQAVVTDDGVILVVGGRSGGLLYPAVPADIGRVLATCELYDPSVDLWFKTGYMAVARYGHRAIFLPDGRVLAIGGIGFNPAQPTVNPVAQASAEIWNPVTGAWSPAGTMAWARDHVIAEYLPSRNQVIVTGGSDAIGKTKTEIFDVATMKWSISPATLSSARVGASSAILGNDIIVVYGGYNPSTGNSTGATSIYVPNADKFLGGGLNGIQTVTATPSPTTFQYETDEEQYTLNASTTATATPMEAEASSIPGPFIYDTDGVAVTSIDSNVSETLFEGQRYAFVDVDDATTFPDAPGWLVFGFGYEYEVAPVKYFGRLSSTRLALDYSFKFTATVPQGASVTWLSQKGPWIPTRPQDFGAFYITASPAGRVAAEAAIAATVAAGVTINTSITYPGDRGLGGEGLPTSGSNKLSDVVAVFAGDDIDAEVEAAREDV